MQRVLQHSSTDVAAPEGFAATTVDITREDGTELEFGAAVTGGVYTLTTAATAELDALTFEWIAADGQRRRTFVEVVGGFTFTLEEAKKAQPIRDFPQLYPDDRLAAARTAAEWALEQAAGVSFTPRYGRAVLDGSGSDELFLPWPEARRVIACTVDGVQLDAEQLAEVAPLDYGGLYREAGWPEGRRNIEVRVEHGFAFPPGRVPHAALALALWLITDGPLNDRAISSTNEDGTYQSFVVAGVKGATFAIPEVNAVLKDYDYTTGVEFA